MDIQFKQGRDKRLDCPKAALSIGKYSCDIMFLFGTIQRNSNPESFFFQVFYNFIGQQSAIRID